MAVNLLSKATFSYLNPMLKLGSRRPLEEPDLPSLLPRGSRHAADSFERKFDALRAIGVADQPHAAARALFRAFGKEFMLAGAVKLVSDACQLASPLLLRNLIGKLEAGAGMRGGAKATAALFVVSAVQAFSLRHYFSQLFACGLKIKAAIICASYRKLLRLAPAARLATSAGEVTNLLGQDAQRIADLVPYLHALWFAPLQVVVALGLLYAEVGVALLPGVAVVGLMLAANKWIAKQTFFCQVSVTATRGTQALQPATLMITSMSMCQYTLPRSSLLSPLSSSEPRLFFT